MWEQITYDIKCPRRDCAYAKTDAGEFPTLLRVYVQQEGRGKEQGIPVQADRDAGEAQGGNRKWGTQQSGFHRR